MEDGRYQEPSLPADQHYHGLYRDADEFALAPSLADASDFGPNELKSSGWETVCGYGNMSFPGSPCLDEAPVSPRMDVPLPLFGQSGQFPAPDNAGDESPLPSQTAVPPISLEEKAASARLPDALFLDGWLDELPAAQAELVPVAERDLATVTAYLVGTPAPAKAADGPLLADPDHGLTDFLVGAGDPHREDGLVRAGQANTSEGLLKPKEFPLPTQNAPLPTTTPDSREMPTCPTQRPQGEGNPEAAEEGPAGEDSAPGSE